MKRDTPAAPGEAALSDATAAARSAGLCYVHDYQPGIARRKRGKRFHYVAADGHSVKDADTLARIKSLAIPPAWTDVWICAHPRGHLQATGRDARGRKQYRYHPRWRSHRDESKYDRILGFGKALPAIRRAVGAALQLPGLPREKVLATIVHLLEATMMRIGNEEYARENKSFGLTTLHDRHVRLDGSKVEFRFRGKSGVHHAVAVEDRRLANIIRRIRDLPGQELFQYIGDDGLPHAIGSSDVNEYLHTIAGEDYTAKDFRTWSGTVLAAVALREYEKFDSEAQAKRNVVQAIEAVAKKLGNTPTICRKCYVHPSVIECYLDGTMLKAARSHAKQQLQDGLHALRPEEAAVLALLQHRLQASAASDRR